MVYWLVERGTYNFLAITKKSAKMKQFSSENVCSFVTGVFKEQPQIDEKKQVRVGWLLPLNKLNTNSSRGSFTNLCHNYILLTEVFCR